MNELLIIIFYRKSCFHFSFSIRS